MKVQVVSSNDRRLELRVEDTSPAFLNGVRRTLQADVAKLAIDDVTVYDNNSALFDEVIAHRLGLLPIPTDLKSFNRRADCTCGGEGCPSCTVLFTLTAEGPGVVHAKQLQPVDPRFAVAEPDVPVVRLDKGQRVMLEATAILGSGSDHAKWCPVTACGYREWPTIRIKGPLALPTAQRRELAALLPASAVEVRDDGTLVVKDDAKAAQYLHAAAGLYDLDNVEFGHEPGVYLFLVETDGSLTAKAAFQEGLRLLMERLKAVEEQVAELKSPA